MATETLPDGASAQIITHARFLRDPVKQHPRRGRFPKGVISFWKVKTDSIYARTLEEQRLQSIQFLTQKMQDHDWIANQYRIQLELLKTASRAV